MNSLCRLCADAKSLNELKTNVSELESKLLLCCNWCPSVYEAKMPTKACGSCVEQLERSWFFAESIKIAETKLNKLIIEEIQPQPVALTTLSDAISIDEFEMKPVNCLVESKELEMNDDILLGDPITASNETCSNSAMPDSNLDSPKDGKDDLMKEQQKFSILTHLDKDEFIPDGTISASGVAKLKKLFPETTALSWMDCEYKCGNCNRTFKGPHNFYTHYRSVHAREVQTMCFKCFYCEFESKYEFMLSRHLASEHFPLLKLRCYYCEDYFWNSRELTRHRDQHTNIEYKCGICNRICLNRGIFYQHISYKHLQKRKPIPESKFTCDICSKKFSSKWSIKNHMLQHNQKFDYICDACGMKFRSKGNLKQHLIVHLEVRNFVCKDCGDRFETESNLKLHSRVHQTYLPIGCELCDKRFRRRGQLTHHMRRHNNIRPYACKYCEKKFTDSSNLQAHERIHTNEKPYACEHCDYRSTTCTNLKLHSKLVHAVEPKFDVISSKRKSENF